MEKFKGTPAPWRLVNDNEDIYQGAHTIVGGGEYDEWTCVAPSSSRSDYHLANARLIAAAPELLDALQKAISLIKSTFSAHEWDASVYYEVINGEKVIKKALGIKE